jgi:hypothetical protein
MDKVQKHNSFNVILPVILHVHEISSLCLREIKMLRVFQDKVLRRIFVGIHSCEECGEHYINRVNHYNL